MSKKNNKNTKIQKSIACVVDLCGCLFIGVGIYFYERNPSISFLCNFFGFILFFLGAAIFLTAFGNENNEEHFSNLEKKYSDFDLSKVTYFSDDSFSSIGAYNSYNIQKYNMIPNQIFLENLIKKDDSKFDKVEFKQRAITRFHILERCLKEKNIDELKKIEDSSLYEYQKNNLDELEYFDGYNVIYSNIDSYEVKDGLEYLKFNITIQCSDKKYTTISMLFSRKEGDVTSINEKITARNCPSCGGTLLIDSMKCPFCNEYFVDDFGWTLKSISAYGKED